MKNDTQFNRRKFLGLSALTAASLPLGKYAIGQNNPTNIVNNSFKDRIVCLLYTSPSPRD